MFSIASPWFFLLLPLPWVARRWIAAPRQGLGLALKVPFYERLAHMVKTQSAQGRWAWRALLAYLVWGLLVLACANPKWLGEPLDIAQRGRNIMLAIDISGSMQLPDMVVGQSSFDRLTAVKVVAKHFIENRVGDRVGLILFGSKAYLQTPLTFDRATVSAMLEDASIGLAGPQTALGDAIGLALKHHLADGQERSVLVLLTDGVNNSGNVSPIEAANRAAAQGLRIYTIGVGAASLVIQGLFGPQKVNPSTDLDEETLKTIAHITKGQYFRAKDPEGLRQIYAQINQAEPVSQELITLRPAVLLYYWPLGVALLLMMVMAFSLLLKGVRYSRESSATVAVLERQP